MPAYDFRCRGCGAITEVIRPFSESGTPFECSCGQLALRMYNIGGVTFEKGRYNFHNGPTYREELAAAKAHPDVISGKDVIRDGIRHI